MAIMPVADQMSDMQRRWGAEGKPAGHRNIPHKAAIVVGLHLVIATQGSANHD